jgi:hypothetical protein
MYPVTVVKNIKLDICIDFFFNKDQSYLSLPGMYGMNENILLIR